MAAFVEDAVAKGARLLLGGKVPAGKGFFYPPTVLADVPDNADCLRDEIFGPVAAIQTFTDEAEVDRPGERHRVRAGRLRLHRRPRRAGSGSASGWSSAWSG